MPTHSKYSLLLVFALLVGLGTSLMACHSDSKPRPAAANSKSNEALRLALTPTLDCLPFFYIVRSGMADSLRLALRLKNFDSQMDADTAIFSKYFDGGVTDRFRLAQAGSKAQKLTRLVEFQTPWSLVLNANLRLPQLNKLKGRTIAIARNAASEAMLLRLLDSLHLKRETVYRPQINSYTLRLQMVENQQIDAAVLPEPYTTWAQTDGHKPIYTARTPQTRRAFYLRTGDKRFENKRGQRDLLRRAYNQAVSEISAGNAFVDSTLADYYKLPPEVRKVIKLPRYPRME